MNPSASQSFRTLRIIYGALTFMLVFFGVIVSFLILQPGQTFSPELINPLSYTLAVLGVAGVFLGNFIYGKLIRQIDPGADLAEKIKKLMIATLTRSGCWELPGLFAGVSSFITGSIYLLLILAVMVLLFLFFRPTIDSVAGDLQLTQAEKEELH